jgi:hypothetical protein
MGEKENGKGRSDFKMLTGKPTDMRLLGRPKRRWEDNLRNYLKEICINTRNWVDSALEVQSLCE